MMTSTIGAVSPTEDSSRLDLLFAQDPHRDLDFDEGLEDDDMHHSKPPSRRPLLWILLLLLIIGIAYWILSDRSFTPTPASPEPEPVATARDSRRQPPQPFIDPPVFRENQVVSLANVTGDLMLMGDPANTKPGPVVQSGETLTILDGSFQPTGWVYQVQTPTGQTGWISADKLKSQS